MIITTNIPAMNLNRNIKNNIEKNTAVSEKLSSGLRINKAADDAAGLAISEKMRAQVRGLQVADRNIEDGIGLVQVADGTLNEITNMLHRIRELAVQAASDTNTLIDREAIQKEVDNLISEINIQSQSANFNGIPLFDGSNMGNYGYTYGLKGNPITGGGTNPTVATSSHSLDQLQSNGVYPPSFPMEGIFAIEVQEFGRDKVTAVIDFGSREFIVKQGSSVTKTPFTEANLGDFSRADFDNFFIDTFTNPPDSGGPIASYSSSSGVIRVTTEGFGGSQAMVNIGKKDFTSAEEAELGLSTVNGPVPPGNSFVKYVNSSILGETKNDYRNPSAYNFIGSKIKSTDSSPSPQDLWDMVPNDTVFTFQVNQQKFYSSDINHPNGFYDMPQTPVGGAPITVTKAQLGATFADVNAKLATLLAGNPDFDNPSINISHFVDREGYVYISLTNTAIPNPAKYPQPQPPAPPTDKYTVGDWVIRTYPTYYKDLSPGQYNASTTPPMIKSDYPLTISGNIGTLTITIGNIPNKGNTPNPKTATIVVDFAQNTITSTASGTVSFSSSSPNDTTNMLAVLNQVLNHSGHAPNPPSEFPIATTGQEVGIAKLDTNGALEIALSESSFTINITEKESDRPILLHRYSYQKTGIDKPPPKGLWIQGGANQEEGMFIYIPRLDAYDIGLMIKAIDHALPDGDHRAPGGINGSNSIAGTGGVNMGVASYSTDANIEPEPLGYGLDVTTQEKANAAIKIADNAIDIISTERAQLGASQNRLESMDKNVNITAENLTFAESRIRDTNMTKEIIEYTKTQTILQESMSLMNQVNKSLENALQLFR